MKKLSGLLMMAAVLVSLTYSSGIYAKEVGVVDTSSLNVRSEASKSGDVIGTVNEGDRLTVLGEEGGWYKVDYYGQEGYVSADYVYIDEEIADDDEVEEESEASTQISTEEVKEEVKADVSSLKEGIKPYLILVGAVLLIVIIIIATVKSIKKMDEEDDDDYYEEDDYDEDDYDEDDYYEEPVRRRRSRDDYDEEPVRRRPVRDDYDEEPVRRRRSRDDYDEEPVRRRPVRDDYDEEAVRRRPARADYDDEAVRRPRQSSNATAFDLKETDADRRKTAASSGKYMSDNPDDYRIDIDPSVFDDDDTVSTSTSAAASKKEADLEAAMKKMEELQKEIERIKRE